MVAIVIPAHNEEQVIGDLLASLTAQHLDAEIVVVANGCTDGTASAARSVAGVRVVETPVPSKCNALALGDRHVSRFPRFYVDADVVLGGGDVRELATTLELPGIHAVAPARQLPMQGVSLSVRAYYAVWRRLPGVAGELYGRGVIGVDRTGHERLGDWREAMSDDLLVAMSFTPDELRVVEAARAVIRPPRRYRDLLRRRVRAMTGNRRLARDPGAPVLRGSGAGLGPLARLARHEPVLLPGIAVFAVTAVLAKARGSWAAARGHTVWLRDESSRTGNPPVDRPAPTLHAAASAAPRKEHQ